MKNSPLKQNYTKKRSKAGMILDPAGFFQTHEAPPAIVKDVAVGAVVSMLSKPKKAAKIVRITGGKDHEEENRIA